jgi:hypothetical protein
MVVVFVMKDSTLVRSDRARDNRIAAVLEGVARKLPRGADRHGLSRCHEIAVERGSLFSVHSGARRAMHGGFGLVARRGDLSDLSKELLRQQR